LDPFELVEWPSCWLVVQQFGHDDGCGPDAHAFQCCEDREDDKGSIAQLMVTRRAERRVWANR